MTEPQAETPFAKRIQTADIHGHPAWILPTPVRDVVTFRGSFYAYPRFEEGEEAVQELVTTLLDKGTKQRDRFAIADVLENRGAQISYDSDALRVSFSGRALRDDLPTVLELAAEQLKTPALDADEFEKARKQVRAGLQRMMDNAGARARGAMSRRLYAPAHPNYMPPPESLIEVVDDLTLDRARTYHDRHFGARGLRLAFVGDINPAQVADLAREHFGDWPAGNVSPAFEAEAAPRPAGRSVIEMEDRQNVDVRLGHVLHLRRDDPDYVPLYLANYVLGGNFSARLMAKVRDEQGLTYGIGSAIADSAREHDAHWAIYVTLSSPVVEQGIAATRSVIEEFVAGGITSEELASKKTTITGAYKVGLASTSGLAGAMLRAMENGFDPDYLDRFPAEVNALDLDTVNAAIRKHFRPDDLHEAIAGTLAAEVEA